MKFHDLGRWHHGDGNLCSGTIRVARASFDTNPPKEMQAEIFGLMADALNTIRERMPDGCRPERLSHGKNVKGFGLFRDGKVAAVHSYYALSCSRWANSEYGGECWPVAVFETEADAILEQHWRAWDELKAIAEQRLASQ